MSNHLREALVDAATSVTTALGAYPKRAPARIASKKNTVSSPPV
jgi:hypothetical protein